MPPRAGCGAGRAGGFSGVFTSPEVLLAILSFAAANTTSEVGCVSPTSRAGEIMTAAGMLLRTRGRKDSLKISYPKDSPPTHNPRPTAHMQHNSPGLDRQRVAGCEAERIRPA